MADEAVRPTEFTERLREARAQTTTFPHSAIVFFDEAAEEIERLNALVEDAISRLCEAVTQDNWMAVETLCEEMERGLNVAPK